ncbi:alcohol dehydrogenase class-3 chain L [Tetranychus urticae]|uniref:Enoyl reductase (ER) domain-containing protein n=1 Tax=Tetranychus urticae TaxID=32264 RepID=T1L2G1_TETUR|nr:alcohol dehydrogenase class-3 chain L [Tetranychus urticae]
MGIGEPIECRAAVLWKSKGPLTIEQVTVKPPTGKEVRVKIVASGVCHSDLIDYAESGNAMGDSLFPYIPGHEGTGIVESIGEDVTKVQAGDKVFVMFFGRCGECPDCIRGLANYCMPSLMNAQITAGRDEPPFSVNGQPLYRFIGASTFSEYTLVEQDRVVKIERDVDLRRLCPLACGVPTGYGSAVNISGITKGTNVAIWGLGTLGLAAGLGASHREASMIIGVDLNSDKFKVAQKFGFTHFVNPKELEAGKTTVQAIKELTNGLGVDHTVCCVGATVAMKDAVDSLALKCTSRAALVGLPVPGAELAIPITTFLTGVTVTGGLYGGFKHEDIDGLVGLAEENKIDLDQFITSQRTLDEIKEAFDELTASKVLRTVIIMDPTYSF